LTRAGADKTYDTRDFVDACRERGVTPHVAQNEHSRRRSAIDGRTTRGARQGSCRLSHAADRCISV
jgi:hypothetical protein